jgi:P27 family predicted phage terminase small subunit
MSDRGPPPTPTQILKLRGSWRGDRNPSEPLAEPGRPRRPKWLDPVAKSAWRRLVPMLERMGALARIDGNALARYCRLWSRWRAAEDFIAREGEFYVRKDEAGHVRAVIPFPQVRAAAQLAEQLLRLEREFGMTPASRARLSAPREDAGKGGLAARYLRVGS